MTKCVQCFVNYSLYFPVSFTLLPPFFFFFKYSQSIWNQESQNWKGYSLIEALSLAEDTKALMGREGGTGQTPGSHSQSELSTPAHENQEGESNFSQHQLEGS